MNLYKQMVERVAADADPTACIEDIRIFTNWVLVKTRNWSLSTYFHNMPGFIEPLGMNTWMGDWLGRPGRTAALTLLESRETLSRSVGMACLKSLLPEPPQAINGNAMDLVAAAAARVPTCCVGYFKTAAQWREQGAPVNIVELLPRPGDIHWLDADEVLAQAELVLITGLTLVNETLEEVIRRTPAAKIRVLMGPTVPASAALFDFGIDLLGISQVAGVEIMTGYAQLGGGSIAYAPAGALTSLNMAKNERALKEQLVAMARRN